MARQQDIAVTAWGLIGGGVLSGKYGQPEAVKRYDSATKEWMEAAEQVGAIATQVGRTPAQVAIRWVYQQQAKAQIIPILGARNFPQMEENLGMLDFELDPKQMAELDRVAIFDPGFPWAFLHSENVLNLTHGRTAGLLDNHRA
jgi:aryl-alcohol dehydrogenase-like predicted oxidoreductase